LATASIDAIKKALRKPGQKVGPQNELPFMVVFSNLPDDLEEFTIEVAGSSE
jgi:hypothetical protein